MEMAALDNRIKLNQQKITTRSRILRNIIHQKKTSKTGIAETLGISVPTVLYHTNGLADAGLLAEKGEFESTGGRKAKIIVPVADAKYAVGIDITKNHVGFVLTDLSGNAINHTRICIPFSCEDAYFSELWSLAGDFLKNTGKSVENFLGFGISIPGIVNSETQVIEFSHALGISGVPCQVFSKYFDKPCIFINDANAAMCAEMYDEINRSTTAYLSLSNTVGGSFYSAIDLINEGQVIDSIYLGDNFRSYEFGHMTLFPGGRECYCKKIGCVDAYCSAKVLSSHTDGDLESFFRELEMGNRMFSDTWNTYLDNLAVTVNNLRMAFDCQVVIGGYVGNCIGPYFPELIKRASVLNTFENSASYLKKCKYKIEASALGAALQHIEIFIYQIDSEPIK